MSTSKGASQKMVWSKFMLGTVVLTSILEYKAVLNEAKPNMMCQFLQHWQLH
jgi:heat shock protein HspQ